MSSFFEKSLNTLELPAVLGMLAGHAVSETAKEQCCRIIPSVYGAEVSKLVQETTDACRLMVEKGAPAIGSIRDVRAALSRAELGGALNTRELLDIAYVLKCARLVRGYIADGSAGKTSIDYLFGALKANKFLEEKIGTSIVGTDEIADNASDDLADIRRKMRSAAARARDALQKIISSPSYAKCLQENIITMRSDRYVVPVKAEYRNQVPGLVHDVSSTGATLFVEPMGAVKANNELRELTAMEKLEIEKILAQLSAECAEHADDISSDQLLLTQLDVIFAKAKLSFAMNGCAAERSEKEIILRRARHPLLAKETAVPIDVKLGDGFDTLIITGPNTGGKTVSLKTIGLLAAMNQCGLHIPATDGSRLPVFSGILADIGDEQSIEQNLSTFSGHMASIVSILEECDERSLVLFDELGAGTDPTEGAALAVSIIESVRKRGAMVAATTHYTELKVYATNEEGVQNASCEFDVETLRPTYRLLTGIPGKSNAFAISRRLGLDEDIINDARARISTGSASFEATIEKLEKTQNLLDKERLEAEEKLREARESAKKANMLRAELEVRLEKADIKARREAERIINDARRTAEDTFRELDDMKKRINDEKSTEEENRARSELRRRLNENENALSPVKVAENENRVSSRPVRAGDIVLVKAIGMKAEVTAVSPDRTLQLKAGVMSLSAREDEVLLLEGEKPAKKKQQGSYQTAQLRTEAQRPEIDLRGLDSLEAVASAEQFIDNAVMGNLKQVVIIHGKGTGALRSAVQSMLKRNKHVKSFRLGTFGEGESGVTIVELK